MQSGYNYAIWIKKEGKFLSASPLLFEIKMSISLQGERFWDQSEQLNCQIEHVFH